MTATLYSDMNTTHKAMQLINDFTNNEYGSDADFSTMEKIGIAYTTDDNDNDIQVSVDLVNYRMIFEHAGYDTHYELHESLDNLITEELNDLDFNELVSRH